MAGSRPAAVASGEVLCIRLSIITPDAPSIVAWWYFVSSAHRPLSKPSMTYTSHSGRLRSIGRPTILDTCSASWSARPGGARLRWRMWNSRSKFGSITQYGWSRRSGTSARRRRIGSIWPTNEPHRA